MHSTIEAARYTPLVLSQEAPEAILERLVHEVNGMADPLNDPIIIPTTERHITPPLFAAVKKEIPVTPIELAQPYDDDTDVLERVLSGLRALPGDSVEPYAKRIVGRARPVIPRRPEATWNRPQFTTPYVPGPPQLQDNAVPLREAPPQRVVVHERPQNPHRRQPGEEQARITPVTRQIPPEQIPLRTQPGHAEQNAAVAVAERPAPDTAFASAVGVTAVREAIPSGDGPISDRLHAHSLGQGRKISYKGLRRPERLGSRLARVGRRLGVLGMTAAVSFFAMDAVVNHLNN